MDVRLWFLKTIKWNRFRFFLHAPCVCGFHDTQGFDISRLGSLWLSRLPSCNGCDSS